MAKRSRATNLLVTFVLAIALCITIAFVGTYALLTDSRTASGTVKFNLADYNLYLNATSTFTGDIVPGSSGTTKTVEIINSYKTTSGTAFQSVDGGGTTAGMGAVYLKIVLGNSLTIGDMALTKSALSSNSSAITIATNSSYGVTVKLKTNAGVGYWNVDNGAIYLMSQAGGTEKSTLAFSDTDKTLNTATKALINFEVSIDSPTGVNNGFNATGKPDSSIMLNEYQGQTITIPYTVYWATTTTELG